MRPFILFSALHLSLVNGLSIYLNTEHPARSQSISLEAASAAVSRHLGLDLFEAYARPASEPEELDFVGKGRNNALLLTIHESDTDIIPLSLFPCHPTSVQEAQQDSIISVLSTFVYRAKNAYSNVVESWNIDHLHSVFEQSSYSKFATLDLSSLSEIREEYGKDSVEYRHAAQRLLSFLEAQHDTAHIAILTYGPDLLLKRQDDPQHPLPSRPPPQEPLGSVSTCFTSVDSCNNATSQCSGRGQCVQATKAGSTKSCFVCTCAVTKTGQGAQVKTQKWVGESCERLDVSGPFVLFTGTALAMILIAFGSVSLLYSLGNVELPSTLTGNAVVARKD